MTITTSLGIMGAVSQSQKSTSDLSLQQVWLGVAIVNDRYYDGNSKTCDYISTTAGSTCAGMVTAGAVAVYLSTTNPVGWGYWISTGVVGL